MAAWASYRHLGKMTLHLHVCYWLLCWSKIPDAPEGCLCFAAQPDVVLLRPDAFNQVVITRRRVSVSTRWREVVACALHVVAHWLRMCK